LKSLSYWPKYLRRRHQQFATQAGFAEKTRAVCKLQLTLRYSTQINNVCKNLRVTAGNICKVMTAVPRETCTV
jgi:hypothetical protein